ncbi:poly(ADP-ribose) glycohydrolase [Besnoitia besnoiti]|uniref:poly(ADP-ribose) glycohydrolase n=1 Tax=Besnoitia besnoiti TaxID=94643 RepID=A0A2A9MDT0_BESBE|nr:poly(ADP-ribose) glycohydrolase [Besnoitia besnoiti]PFH36039.1 poly(ADP-ribose) glycohydrolase [Besnoitia besnoiti]
MAGLVLYSLLVALVLPFVCRAQTPEQLKLMSQGHLQVAGCAERPCAVLRTPVDKDWDKVKFVLGFIAQGQGPADSHQLASLHTRLLTLSGNLRTDKVLQQHGLLEYLKKKPGTFFTEDLPFLASIVLHLEDLFPDGLQYVTPELPQAHLRKIQVLALVAAAFLGVVPHNQRRLLAHHPKKFQMNQNKLDMFYRGFMEREAKFRSLLIYFASMRARLANCWNEMMKAGIFSKALCVTPCQCATLEDGTLIAPTDELLGIYRQTDMAANFSSATGSVKVTSPAVSVGDIANSQKPLLAFEVLDVGDISTSDGDLQVDFADQYLGGLSMFKGDIAQEEFLFITYPELLPVMLLSDIMRANEAVVMKGAERFVFSDGYEWTFRITAAAGPWTKLPPTKHYGVQGVVPMDRLGRRDVTVVGIDAVQFFVRAAQYTKEMIDRELLKAVIGFKGDPFEEVMALSHQAVATGLWGCGVFNGDAQLKSLLQWMAASYSGRATKFYTFANKSVKDLARVIPQLRSKYSTVSNLYNAIKEVVASRPRELSSAWSLWGNLL